MNTLSNHFIGIPATNPGRRSVWLGLVFVVTFAINILVNIYVIDPNSGQLQFFYIAFVLVMLACGLAGGVYGLIAVTKQHERSLFVWISILCGLFVLLIVSNELLQGIQYLLNK